MSDLTTIPAASTVSQSGGAAERSRRRKLKAVLAGGVVLGVGAAVTLAAWNDSEFAAGIFGSGVFDLEGSTDGKNYADHSGPREADVALLSFRMNPANLAPGDVVYAPFAVRLKSGTTHNATVVIKPAGQQGTVEDLTYELLQTNTPECSAGTTGTELVAKGAAVNTVPKPAGFPLNHGSSRADPGAPVFVCFKVTAGDRLAQGQAGAVGWQFAATSGSD